MIMRTKVILLIAFVLMFTLSPALSVAQAPDRSKPPELGPPAPLKLPPVQHLKLSSGLPVILMEKHDVPLIQVEVLVRTGIAMDPAGKSGLASMVASMLEEGAGSRNSLELADAIDFLGADIGASSSWHSSTISLHTPVSKIDSALALLGDIAMRPKFPPEELERKRKERLTSLMQWHDEPRAISNTSFSQTLYGKKHPYGVPQIGNEKSLRSISVEDLRKFHSAYYGSNNATLIVVGDVTPSSILPKLESVFGSWGSGAVPQSAWPEIRQVEGRIIYLVDKPGAAQSVIRIGRIGVPRMTEDFYPLLVMNTILGGSFTSRLNQNLREKHGYTYGASSSFDYRVLSGPFSASSSVQTAVTDKALIEFMKELKDITGPIPEEEIQRAKNYVALGYPASFQSVAQIAGQLASMVFYSLPDGYLNNYIGNINAVTKSDVERVAKKYIDPDNIAIVIVGDRKQIEKGIRETGIAKIQNLTIDEVLGPAPALGGRDK